MDGIKLAITQGEGSMTTKKRADQGFTLIEILVALALTSIVLTAIYTAFQSQHKTYIAQESVAEMQQNLRAAMFLMVREIRMAGFNPRGTADASIDSTSNATCIYFNEDIRGTDANDPPDGATDDPTENIKYSLSASSSGNNLVRTTTSNKDNISCDLTAGTPSTIAENISTINFIYLDADGTTPVAPENARVVEITIVAQTDRSDPDYTNTFVYRNRLFTTLPWEFDPTPDDGFHRRALSTLVKCRNLGL